MFNSRNKNGVVPCSKKDCLILTEQNSYSFNENVTVFGYIEIYILYKLASQQIIKVRGV